MKIPKATLSENRKYKLIVRAYNEVNSFIEEYCKEMKLYTGTLPTIETLTIEPETGIVYDTEFTITLSNYTPKIKSF